MIAPEPIAAAEEKLVQQREWFRVTLASIGDAVITTDTHALVTFLNPVAEALTGWQLAEVLGQPLQKVFHIVHEKNHRTAPNPVTAVLRRGKIVGLANHTVLIARDGREIAIEDSAAPIKDATGEILGAVMVFHDVTEQRRAKEALELLSRLPAENPAPVLRLSRGRILSFVNPAARQQFAGFDLKLGEAASPEIIALASGAVKGDREANFFNRTYQIAVMSVAEGDYVNLYFTDITARKLAEMERERLTRVLERSLNEIYIFDTETLRFEYVNEGALRNLGYTPEEIHQKTPLDLKPEFTEASFRQMVGPLLAGEKEKHIFHTVHRRRDGTHYPVEVHLQPVVQGRRRVFLAVILDITERRTADEALRRSEEELRALADSIPQLTWMAEADGNIFWYNQRWYDYTGTTLEQMKGWGWEAVHDPAVLPRVLERWREAIASGESFEMEFPLRAADGTYRRFLTRANSLRDRTGRVIRWFGTNTDVEEAKQGEENLAAARDLAEAANKTKDQFLAALSHELRTPLTPVLALLSSFDETSGIPPDLAADLATMRRNVELEVRLIDDLLDLTRITRDRLDLHYRPIALQQVINDAINTCPPELKTKSLKLLQELQEPGLTMVVDNARITQILWNLLKNSVKFTPAGGAITIRSRRDDTGQVLIQVEDTGIGIEPAHVGRIFDAFEQGDHELGRQFGGLGLGLAISRAIAEAHHGTLSVISEGAGRGSTFTLALPLSPPPGTAKVPSLPAKTAPTGTGHGPARMRSLRILLVEDHADTAASLGMLLDRRGHQVSIARTVAEALKAMATSPFDLLLSDLGLPDGTGHELMRQIRERHSIPAIALSGYGMDDDVQRCREAGFNGHLVKPVRIAQLEEALAGVVRV